ncbi:MAG: hypothetical protein ACJA04_001236 [Cellvibrionaceae bacterium]|jgi:uncharacterized protein (DUF2062 family)
MPRKIFKRFLPHHTRVRTDPKLRFLAPFMKDPNLFHLNRYSVSIAFLVGVFTAFLPIPGQMLLAGLIAFWVRCNLPIALALVWITNPLTITPILFMNYKLGAWMLGTPPLIFDGTMDWQWLSAEFNRVWKPLLLGSLMAGSFFSLLSYLSLRYLWLAHVGYQWRHRQKKRLQRHR